MKKNCLKKGIINAIKNKRDYEIILLRLNGMKLDDVGKKFDITRERVRQLELRGKNEIIDFVENNIFEEVFKDHLRYKEYLDNITLKKELGEELFNVLIYAYKTKSKSKKTELNYIPSIQTIAFYDNSKFEETIKYACEKSSKDITENVLNDMKSILTKKGYNINKEMIKLTLRYFGYDFYGEFVLRENINLGESIRNEVKYNYKNGVKTSNKEEINELKDKLIKNYKHKNVKSRNVISRIQQSLFLWDASTYTHEDNVFIDKDLEDDIIKYITCMHEQGYERISYKKIYEVFEDEIKENSNFINYHSLHGHLSRISKEKDMNFVCIKFYVCKKGTEDKRSKVYFRDVVKFLEDKPNGASKEEIKKELPNFDHTLLRYTPIYYPQIVRWNNGMFLNLDSIEISDKDKKKMRDVLEINLNNQFNYTSKYILYDYYEKNEKELLERITCLNDKNKLFDLNKYYFDKDFVFNQPHILKRSFKDSENFTSEVFANYLIEIGYEDNLKDALKTVIKIYKNKLDISSIS